MSGSACGSRVGWGRLIPLFLSLLLLGSALAIAPPAFGASGNGDPQGAAPMLVKTRVDITSDVLATLQEIGSKASYVWPEIRALAMSVPPSKVDLLRANPLVESVEADVEGGAGPGEPEPAGEPAPASVVVPPTAFSTPIQTWNLDMADVAGSGRSGAGVTVAVIDAGLPQNWTEFLPEDRVDLAHAVGFGAEGWGDFHSELHAIRGVGGYIGLFPHGVAVSSVIVGFPSDFGPVGGAAPGATILPIRVLNRYNSTWSSWCAAAFMYVGDLKASGAVPGPLVVNFSIQFHSAPQVMADAIAYALSKGVLVVTIAGNFHPNDYVSFPGRMPECITAGAVGWRLEGLPPDPWFFGDVAENDPSQAYVASFSGREPPFADPGSAIDVLAPGSFVFGEWLAGPGFSEGREVAFDAVSNFIFGTSFSAPHVAGIVAQMLEKNPALTQAQAEAILRGSALPVSSAPSGISTPIQFVLPWDARATGAGLARGAAAVAATPPGPALAAASRFSSGGEPRAAVPAAEGSGASFAVRVTSPVGSLPVRLAIEGMGAGGCRVAIMDVQGRAVLRWEGPASGSTNLVWDGAGRDGGPAGPGVYFIRAESGGTRANARAIVTR